MRFHSIREHIKDGDVRVVHVQSNDQAANIFTKALFAETIIRELQADVRDDEGARLEFKRGC
jgi:hypothetical protein